MEIHLQIVRNKQYWKEAVSSYGDFLRQGEERHRGGNSGGNATSCHQYQFLSLIVDKFSGELIVNTL